MGSAIPVPPQYGPQIHNYAPPAGGPFPQVNIPFTSSETSAPYGQKLSRKKGARWESENRSSQYRQQDSSQPEVGGRARRHNKRRDSAVDYDRFSHGRGLPVDQQALLLPLPPIVLRGGVLDLTPGPEGFDRVDRMLTEKKKQNYGYGGYDPSRAGHMAWPGYGGPNQQMYQIPGSPAPNAYANPYVPPGSFVPPPAPNMSRGNSQISERPASSTGNQGGMGMPGLGQPPKGPVIASSNPTTSQFVRPKSTAIKIKNAAGEEINLASLKGPASPAPSIQQSKTPPVIATTPTPPPKVGTPVSLSHGRNESTTKPPEDIRTAFMEQVKKSKEGDAAKTDEEPAVDSKAKSDELKPEAVPASTEKADEAPAPPTEKAEATTEVVADEKAEIKPEEVSETKAESKTELETPETSAKTDEKPAETEDEYMERMIREMEEEDARREAEQAEITAKKDAEKEVAKKKAEEERVANAAENDRKLREQEREMERLEEEKEKARREAETGSTEGKSLSETLASKISTITGSQKKEDAVTDKLSKLTINSTSSNLVSPGSAPSSAKSTGKDRRPAALNLAPLKTGSVEAPPPSAAMQALKSARFLTIRDEIKYPVGIHSPNPATNAAAAKKGGSFQYDSAFLLQFQKVFTEQPSVEFSQQVKALIGDTDGSRSASTRGSGAGGPGRSGSKAGSSGGAFGAFTQAPAGKPLPPGTTSEQRFAISQGQISRPASGMVFGRGVGNFPSASQMTRTASGLAMGGSRSGSRNQTRGGSKQGKGYEAQADAKRDKTMPLTQGMDLKPIVVSEKGWKPMSIRKAQEASVSGHIDPETVQRKVKAALNKMTPENFDKISQQILDIAAQSKAEDDGRTLRQVIQLTFEKATDESHWAAMYAKFCKRMLENMSAEVKDSNIKDKNGQVVSGGALFRKYLLNRCQEDFERGWNVDMPEPKEGESKEAAMLSDEYYQAAAIKRRGLGLVQFIGELFKLGMLTERIMHECVRKLLDFKDEPDEHEIESLTKLLRTIGANLDSTEKGNAMMNAYFERISTMVETDLPSRLKFMLMDVIDLRKHRWVSKEGLKGPKTLEEIRADVSIFESTEQHLLNNRSLTIYKAEAAAAAKAAEASRTNSRNQPGGRSQLGRGDARHGYGNFQPAQSNTVGMDDLRRLKGTASRTSSGQVTLGPSSMFNSRSNSGRKMGPGGALTRGNEDSAASSRAGTPPTQASANAFA